MNYEDDVKIDESALDVEWINQPVLTRKYTRLLAELEKERDQAKEHVNFVRASLDQDIRKNPEQYKIVKITESTVSNVITTLEDYTEAHYKYLSAQFEAKVAQGVISSLQDRKSALENLVKLHGQHYFAGPSVPRDLSKEWAENEKKKKVNTGVARKLKRARS